MSKPMVTLPYSCRVAQELDDLSLRAAVRVRDWLLLEAGHLPDFALVVSGLGERLNEAGVPVDRISTAADLIHAEYSAVTRYWERGRGSRMELIERRPTTDNSEGYRRSPYWLAHQEKRWVELDLATTPDDAFGIVPELKQAGYVGYLCAPIIFSNETENGITFATRRAGGFSSRDISVLRLVLPAMAAVMEIRNAWRQLDEVLRTYVGKDPHREIMRGAVRRGQVSLIRAAILVADLRGFTRLSYHRSPAEVVSSLNVFFDCLVPPIEQRGGEVLKYMGDGLLAIFREDGRSMAQAAAAALAAAQDALSAVEAADKSGAAQFPLQAGIALHYGTAAYGNVGSGARLDFTVIGEDVNLASRLAGLNKPLGKPLLLSKAFSSAYPGPSASLGEYGVQGLPVSIEVLEPG